MDIKKIYEKFIHECKSEICIDTRKIIPGSLFVALSGEKYDGNIFAEKALELGCSYAIIDNPQYTKNDKYIVVNDSIELLSQIARYHRIQFNIPVIGITGSNGKTTTKELIASVLNTQKNIICTEGNLNNHIGVPLSVLKINIKTEIAIIEMGANHIGEIDHLCNIAMPTHGIITNIGRAHLGLFGGFNGVVRSKTELYNYLEKNTREVFVNASDLLLREKSKNIKHTMYGPEFYADPVVSNNTLPFVSIIWRRKKLQTQLTGEYNIPNISAAIAVAVYFEIQEKNIRIGIENYIPLNQRSEIVETKKGNIIIKDYYNANSSSMFAAIENLANIETKKTKIAVLGDMFELGEYEEKEHRDVMNAVVDANIDMVILVGEAFSKCIHDYQNVYQYKTTDEAIKILKELNIQDSLILLKASNGMNFKKLFNKVNW